MEIIRIGSDKLKLILTDGDLKKYSLKFEGLDYDNTETRRVLWQILDEAKKETGFDAAAERTLVQAYPGRRGGCEIYVTRLAERTRGNGREEVYRFQEADALFKVADIAAARGEEYASALYREEEAYYLLVLLPRSAKESQLSSLSFIEEYAERLKGSGTLAYIREHGECLIEKGALEKLHGFSSEDFFA